MTLEKRDISWLAGYLEGEGCFSMGRPKPPYVTALLVVSTTDLDVASKVAKLLHSKVRHKKRYVANWKQAYEVSVRGNAAIAWMFTVYPMMGERRRARIRQVVAEWKKNPGPKPKRNADCHPDRPHRARGLCNSCYIRTWKRSA